MNIVMHSVPCKTQYIYDKVDVVIERYHVNQRLAIQLLTTNGEPMATLTVNLSQAYCGENEVYIKDYSENEGLFEWAVQAGIILPGSVGAFFSGWVVVQRYNLTSDFINLVAKSGV